LIEPHIAAEAGALVLLGEPGVGKTTVFERLTNSGTVADGASTPLQPIWVDAADLSDVTFDEQLGRHLRALPAKQDRPLTAEADMPEERVADPSAMLIVVIDQLDESPLMRHLAARLRASLTGRDTSGLRLLVACRTADYPAGLTEVLRSACGECVLADLAPLTRDDAVRLASSADQVDGESLIAAAVEAGAGVLASVPLTLGLLIRTHRRTGSLDARPTELFAHGVTQLIEEHDDERQVVSDETSVAQRVAIAGRIAARLLLSGRRTIWRGSVLEFGEQDLNADTVEGGYERTAGGPFAVTKKMALATLGTGLFTGRGENRLAFRHGSFAAYLTARYLIDRDIPRAQMERLFLVAGGDETRSIPTLLREAAAWLVTLDPTHADWLAEADPESLVGHSAIVDSPHIRALIVDALLRRAGEIELGGLPWARSPRRLQHPDLDAQLLAVLAEAGGCEPEDWPSLARVRLAVRLAREAGVSGLAEPLLDLAENDSWSVVMRQQAARTAFEVDPDVAVPRLVILLERFADFEYATGIDPDDEFRGSLLAMLWPGHISVDQLLPHLRRRRNRNFLGSYLLFERTFPERLPDEELAVVLPWATQQVRSDGDRPQQLAPAGDPQTEEDPPDERPVGGLDTEVIEGIADRALAGPTALTHVDDVAALINPRLQRFDHPPLPAATDLEDNNGHEPATARTLRRTLAESLVKRTLHGGDFNRADAWFIIWGWQRGRDAWRDDSPVIGEGLRRANRGGLLAVTDFMWLYQAASRAEGDGDQLLASALGQVAALLYNPSDTNLAELVSADQDHPTWQYVRPLFEPPETDSEHAQLVRHARSPADDAQPSPWPEAGDFAARLNQSLRDALAGDTVAFWNLVWNLQADPSTGNGPRRFDDDLMDFPGIKALDGDPVGQLLDASMHFVNHEHDHASNWLGTERYDKRGWAGYLALALLERHGRLHNVPDAAWVSWVGALTWFPAMHGDVNERDRKRELLSRAATHAGAALVDAIVSYLRGHLAGGRPTLEVELVDPAWDPRLADAWVTILDELADVVTRPEEAAADNNNCRNEHSEPDTDTAGLHPDRGTIPLAQTADTKKRALELWETMLIALFDADGRAPAIARHRLQRAAETEANRCVAIRAVKALLNVDSHTYWPEVFPIIEQDRELSREVALACATGREEKPFFTNADEEQLGQVYRWLSGLFPPAGDVYREGFYIMSPEDDAREWRNRILQLLSARGTEQAVVTLAELSREHPERLVITSNLLRARSSVFASAWSPPRPDELAALFEDTSRRLVRSEGELADLLLEVLAAISQDLPGHGELLWDRLPKRVLPEDSGLKDAWLPKPEAALSSYVAHELSIRIDRRGLAVNREVLILPTDAYGAGERTDVLVQATMRHDQFHGSTPDRLAVVIEVKGPWNKDLMADQRQQLAQRYLPEAQTSMGIYLVGWYPLDLWTDEKDYRRSRATMFDRSQLLADLQAQANSIRVELSMQTTPLLLDVPRPHSRADGDENVAT
jgi:hypothetical protein